MWIHVNNSLVVNYGLFVHVTDTLKEDNLVILQVVYETENSKPIVILKSRG